MIEEKIVNLIDLKMEIQKKIDEVVRNITFNKFDLINNVFTKNFYKRKDVSKIKKKILKSHEQTINILNLKIKKLIFSGNLINLLKNKKIDAYFKNFDKNITENLDFTLLNEFKNIKESNTKKENKKIILDNLRN